MNIEEYIESGILERYVLGETSDWENLQVEAMLKKHSVLVEEVKMIEESLHQLANGLAITPPKQIENKLRSELFGEVIEEREVTKVIPIETSDTEENRSGSHGLRWAVAASIVLLMGSVFYNYYQYKRLSKTKNILAMYSDDQKLLNSNLKELETQLDESNGELKIYHDKENKLICLMGTPDNPDGMAHIYWNTSSNELYVEVNNLPTPPDSLQYQVWAIQGNTAKNAGLLNGLNQNIATPLKTAVDSADAFAITLETRGGVEQPQGKMFAMGKL